LSGNIPTSPVVARSASRKAIKGLRPLLDRDTWISAHTRVISITIAKAIDSASILRGFSVDHTRVPESTRKAKKNGLARLSAGDLAEAQPAMLAQPG
jgi:hypothetical protein